jgi:hypothetical protein
MSAGTVAAKFFSCSFYITLLFYSDDHALAGHIFFLQNMNFHTELPSHTTVTLLDGFFLCDFFFDCMSLF